MFLNRSSIAICLLVLLTGFGGLLVSFSSLYLYLSPKLPSVETLRDYKLSTPLRIYSADRKLIYEYGDKRIPVQINEVPPLLIKALIAIEDKRFYSHNGVDFIGIMRAASHYLFGVGTRSGGSTLTMQVAKKAFELDADRSLLYKAKQTMLALQMEHELTKDEIIELYLNLNELGKSAHGIGAAAQVYYGKSIQELTVAQMAALVGTFQLPTRVNPINNPQASLSRRNLVLSNMLEFGDIDQLQYETAIAEPLGADLHSSPIELEALYVAEMARQEVAEKVSGKIYEDGYIVHVTIDSKLQNAAQQAVVNGILDYDSRHRYRGPEDFKLTPIYVDQDPAPLVGDSAGTTEAETEGQPTAIVEISAEEDLDSTELSAEEEPPAPIRIYSIIRPLKEDQESSSEDLLSRDFEITRINVAPWMEQLSDLSVIADLQPAAVLESEGDELVVLLADGRDISISFKHGPTQYFGSRNPANEKRLSLGNVVRVREKQEGEWYLSQVPEVQGAMVAIDPTNGAIRALVGGFDYDYSKYNRAEQAKRQPGSNFKPLLYTAALENGYSAGSVIIDEPYSKYDSSLEDYWQPQNEDLKFLGPMRLREALYRSRNVVSIHIRNSLGHTTAFKDVGRFGIDYESLPNNDPTLALGTYELTPRQLATAYAVFANGGYKVDSFLVSKIETSEGEEIFKARPLTVCENCNALNQEDNETAPEEIPAPTEPVQASTEPGEGVVDDLEAQLLAELQLFDPSQEENSLPNDQPELDQSPQEEPLPIAPRVIDERTAYIINDILKDVIQESRGTGKKARALGRQDIAGKTGTTDQSHDLWFSGYSPALVATSWVGFDEYKSLGESEFGGTAALPPWIEFMRKALAGVPEVERPMPAGLEIVRINSQTGKPTGPDDPLAVREIFKIENSPLQRDGESGEIEFDTDRVNPQDIF